MSKKSTKIIAAAGVVAGLGVAALPAMTFAAQSVTGSADIYADVLPAIAMSITGNNDDNSHVSNSYGASKAKNPGTITSLDTLDATALADYTTGTAAVTSSSWTSILPNASVHGNDASGSDNGFYSTVTVYTNDTGYNLGIGALSAMTKQYSGTAPASPATIPATGIVKAGVSGWGYATSVQTDATGDPLTANYGTSAATIKTYTDGPTSGGDDTVVYYGVSTSADQEVGRYLGTVTYTATTAN